MKDDLVSVLLPVFNMGETVEEAIKSVLAQKNVEYELIIVNDGSFDHTAAVLEKYGAYSNIKILNQPNLGKAVAFNRAFREAQGGFFVFFAGDDILPEDSLFRRKMLIMQSKDQNSVSCGKLLSFSENKKFNNILIPKNHIAHFSGGVIMFTRTIANRIFPIPEELPNEDTWSMLIIKYFSSHIIISDQVVLRYRIHKKNTINMDAPFDVFTQEIHKRAKAYEFFYNNYKELLGFKDEKEIICKMKLEEIRYSGNMISLLLFRNISFKERMINIVHSNKNLYKLKVLLFRYLTGWNS